MSVQLVRVADRGVPNNERVHLSVTGSVDLAYFAVLKTFRAAATVTAGPMAAFWFPHTLVKPGDQVVLYTGKGTNSNRREASGSTTYFFYWAFQNTLFNTPADCAVLLQAAQWTTSPQGG